MISCMISYHIKDLTVPSPEAVAFQIERVASCLGPSTVELTLPLNATECPKLPFAPVAGNQVVLQDGVQLPCCPLHVPLGRYLQLLSIILTNPCGKFCRQPADDRMEFAIRILEPQLPRQLAVICTNDICLLWKDIQTGWLEKMHIQALLASIVMVSIAVCNSSISFSSLHLYIIHDIRYDIIIQNMISYMIYTWMLCLFNFPAYMDCNVGYRIPSSQATASTSLSTAGAATDSSAPSPSSSCAASARSASRDLRYCR